MPKPESLESLRSKIASEKCPCRHSQISEFVIRFGDRSVRPTNRSVCPVAEKADFQKSESDQSVARFDGENFRLSAGSDFCSGPWVLAGASRRATPERAFRRRPS